MKRFITLTFVLALIFSLISCRIVTDESRTDTNIPQNTATEVPQNISDTPHGAVITGVGNSETGIAERFVGLWHAMSIVAAGFSERYALYDDGTFIYGSSEMDELERELYKTGTWDVVDDKLRLLVEARWILPVGNPEDMVPSNELLIVDGEIIKRICAPPETETYSIARIGTDIETDRETIAIDGVTFYNFDNQTDLLDGYYELLNKAAVNEPDNTDDKPALSSDTDSFEFSDLSELVFYFESGAGAWSTELRIFPDGTFSGNFHDSDMGDIGEDYPNGTVYVCNFSGKFARPVKNGDYEYSMKLESLTQEGVVGGEELSDGMRIITSEPYGFDDADEFTLYLPGKKVNELPQGFLDWVRIRIDSEDVDALSFYGLYNVGGEQGFSS